MEKDAPDIANTGLAQTVIRLEGAAAHESGVPRAACPYDNDPKLCVAWREGSDEAEAREKGLPVHPES